MVALFALGMQGCASDDLPEQGSYNDYKFTFEVSAVGGDAQLLFVPTTDGSPMLLNDEKSDQKPAKFPVRVKKGDKRKFVFTTEDARKVKLDVEVLSGSGSWTVTLKRNGKAILTDKFDYKGGSGTESKSYETTTL